MRCFAFSVACKVAITFMALAAFGQPCVAASCPSLTFLFDTSGSMREATLGPRGIADSDPNKRKYAIAAAATNAFAQMYESQLRLGMAVFPSDGMCGAGILSVPPAPNNASKIQSLLAGSEPTSALPDAPTSVTIRAVVGQLNASGTATAPGTTGYLVLLTDGIPQCYSGSETVQAAVDELTKANAGAPRFKTFVVALGKLVGSEPASFNQMAAAGGAENAPPPAAQYYPALDRAELDAQLQQILGRIRTEVGELGCAVPTPDRCSGVSCPGGYACVSTGPDAGTCQPMPLYGYSQPGCSCHLGGAASPPFSLAAGLLALVWLRRKQRRPAGSSRGR